jgi:hypothetical protein
LRLGLGVGVGRFVGGIEREHLVAAMATHALTLMRYNEQPYWINKKDAAVRRSYSTSGTNDEFNRLNANLVVRAEGEVILNIADGCRPCGAAPRRRLRS